MLGRRTRLAPDRCSTARRPDHRDQQVGQARSSATPLLSDGDIMGFKSPGQFTHKPPQLAAASASSISRAGGTAGWLWNFRLDDVGRWHDSELPSLGGQLDHNEPGLQLEESTSCFQCKKTDSEAAGHHKTTGPILRSCSAEQATTAGD